MDPLEQIEKVFFDYAENINKLFTFDDHVLQAALKYFNDAIGVLERRGSESAKEAQILKTGRQSLSNIRKNKSLRPYYKVIYNQVVVIWVSVLAGTLESIFKYCVAQTYPKLPQEKQKELKIPVAFLPSFGDVREAFPIIVLEADRSISFQDMGSIRRTFIEYFSIDFPDNEHFQNVAFAMMARHTIVHSAGRIDRPFHKNVEKLVERTIMKDVAGDSLEFELQQMQQLSDSFREFVRSVIKCVRQVKGGLSEE